MIRGFFCSVVLIALTQFVQAQKGVSSRQVNTLLEKYEVVPDGDTALKLAAHYLDEQVLDSCTLYARLALKHALSSNDLDQMQAAYWHLSNISYAENNFERALSYLDKAVQVKRVEQDSDLRLDMLNLKAKSLRYLGRWEASVKEFKKGVQLAEGLKKDRFVTIFSINLGTNYNRLKNKTEALAYYTKALQLSEQQQDSLHMGIVLVNLGSFYAGHGDLESSTLCYKQALTIFDAQNNYAQKASLYANLSDVYLQTGDYDAAIESAKNNLSITDTIPSHVESLIVAHGNLGVAYLKTKQLRLAEQHLHKALQSAKAHGVPAMMEELYKRVAELKANQNKHKEAYQNIIWANEIRDSVFDHQMVHKYNLEEKNQELDDQLVVLDRVKEERLVQEMENRRLKNRIGISALLLLVIGVLVYGYFLRQKSMRLGLKKEAAENKLEALRNQMNPHFLFNSFNAVQKYILVSDKKAAYDYLAQIAHLIRKVLDNSHSLKIELNEEIELIESYIKLEKLRFQDKFDYRIQVEENLTAINPVIPSMIIQPYIENAILHGLSNREGEGGTLTIQFSSLTEEEFSVEFQITALVAWQRMRLLNVNQKNVEVMGLQ